MRPPGPWAETPDPTSTRNGPGPTAPPPHSHTTDRPTACTTTAPTTCSTTAPPTTTGPAEPASTAKPLEPAAADGEFAPQGSPAPDYESRTGGAGGNTKAEGGAEAGKRVQGLLLGLAAGDAAGWPAARHRAARMPDWTRRLTRELDTFAEQNATTTLPVPIALNQPPEPLRLGPSDDAEWAAFTAEALLKAGTGTPSAT